MQVETYEIEEQVEATAGTTQEMDAEAAKLIEELGLSGQEALFVPQGKEGHPARVPYPKLDAHERRVYETLYPTLCKLEDYAEGIIPLRVLQVAAYAKKIFPYLVIRHSKVIDPDPILLGKLDAASSDVFLLARWGDALKPFSELVKLAREALVEGWSKKVKTKMLDCESFKNSLEVQIERHLSGEYVFTPF